MGQKKEVAGCYGDVKSGDTIVDRSGRTWVVTLDETVEHDDPGMVSFWLADTAEPGVQLHHLTRHFGDSVTVLRDETRSEEVERREAEVDTAGVDSDRGVDQRSGEETVATELGGEVEAVEVDSTALPPFRSLTDVEQRSHLFVFHGVYADDVKTRDERAALHTAAHADTGAMPARYTHTHDAEEVTA